LVVFPDTENILPIPHEAELPSCKVNNAAGSVLCAASWTTTTSNFLKDYDFVVPRAIVCSSNMFFELEAAEA